MGKEKSFSANGVGTTGYLYGKPVNLDPYLTPYPEINVGGFIHRPKFKS